MRRSTHKLALLAKLLAATALSSAVPNGALAQTAPVVSADGGTQVYQAGNGVTVVNIATPNAAGVSHNRYDQYNVPATGVVLNNGGTDQQTRQSQLAGSIAGNSNITGGQASLIINEVVKANPSTLAGYTEVLGGKADLVLANPWGVTCDGCGFLNTARLVMTTGVPQLDAGGRLGAIRTTDGLLTITGKGLDASAADTLALVARSVKVDAQVNARALDIVGGASSYDPGTGEVTVIAANHAGEYAIDASALGSLYAGRIRLIATDAGVGVRALGNVGATAGDLTITSAGGIVVGGQVSATGAINAVAQAGDLIGDHARLAAGTDLGLGALAGRVLLVGGQLNAVRDLSVAATGFSDGAGAGAMDTNRRDAGRALNFAIAGGAGFNGTIWGGRTLTLASGALGVAGGALAADTVSVRSGTITLDGGGILGKAIDIAATGVIDVARTGFIQGQDGVSVTGSTIGNDGRITTGQAALTLTGALDNTGTIQGYRAVSIAAAGAGITNSGAIAADTLSLNGGTLANSGKIEAVNGAVVGGTSLTNSGMLTGSTVAGGGLTLFVPTIVNTGTIGSAGTTDLAADTTIANGGSLLGNAVALRAGAASNAGTIQAATGTTITATSFANSGTLAGALTPGGTVSITAPTFQNTATGTVTSAGTLTITADAGFANLGRITAIGDLAARTLSQFTNGGTLGSDGAIALRGADASSAGTIQSGTTLTIDADRALSLTGTTIAGSDLTLAGATGATTLTLGGASQAGGWLRTSGTFGTLGVIAGAQVLADRMSLSARAVTIDGQVQATNGLTLDATSFVLTGGLTTATAAGGTGMLTLGALRVGDTGTLRSSGTLGITTTDIAAISGKVIGADALTLDTAQALALTGSALVGSNGALTLVNRTGGVGIATDAQLVGGTTTIAAAGLQNAGAVQAVTTLALDTKGQAFGNTGRVIAGGDLTARTGTIVNTGLISAQGAASLDSSGATASNAGSIVAASTLAMRTGAFANTGDLGAADLSLDTARAGFTNDGQVVITGSGTFATGAFRNNGTISTVAALGVDTAGASFDNAGRIGAGGAGTFAVGTLSNGGLLRIGGNATFTAASVTNQGTLAGLDRVTATIAGDVVSSGGFQATNGLILSAATLDNAGAFYAGSAAGADGTITVGTLTNRAGGLLFADDALALVVARTVSNAGTIAGNTLAVSGTTTRIANTGLIQTSGATTVNADNAVFTNMLAGTDGGRIVAGTFALKLAAIDNNGIIQASGSASIAATGAIANSGTLNVQDTLTLGAAGIANQGVVQALGGLTAITGGTFANSGRIVAAGAGKTGTITAGTFSNDAVVASLGSLAIDTGGFANSATLYAVQDVRLTSTASGALALGGSIQSDTGNVTIAAAGGDIATSNTFTLFGRDVAITGASLGNAGLIQSTGNTALTLSRGFDNAASGVVNAAGTGIFAIGGNATNAGAIQAEAGGSLSADAFTNAGLFVTSTKPAASFDARVGTLTVASGGRVQGSGDLSLTTRSFDNQGVVLTQGALRLGAPAAATTPLSITSGTNSVLQAGGLLSVAAASSDLTIGTGATWLGGTVDVAARSLDLRGVLQSAGAGTLAIGGAYANRGSLYIGQLGTVNAASIANSGLMQGGTLNLTASGAITNDRGLIIAGTAATSNATITAAEFTNIAAGVDTAGKPLASGVQSSGDLTLNVARALTNRGDVLTGGNLTLLGSDLAITNTAAGLFQAYGTLDISGAGTRIVDQHGKLYGQRLNIVLDQTLDNDGEIAGFGGSNTVGLANLNNNVAGTLYFGKDATAGSVSTLRATNLINAGTIQTEGYLTTYATTIFNTGSLIGATAPGGGTLDFRFTGIGTGSLTNQGTVDAYYVALGYNPASAPANPRNISYPNSDPFASIVNNGGRLDGTFIDIRGNVVNMSRKSADGSIAAGMITSRSGLDINGDTVENQDVNAVIYAQTSQGPQSSLRSTIAARRIDNHGLIGSGAGLTLQADVLTNRLNAGIAGGGLLTITANAGAGDRIENSGDIFALDMAVTQRNFTNMESGNVNVGNDANFTLSNAFANYHAVTTNGALSIDAATITNDYRAVQIVNDAPSYWRSNWTSDPALKNDSRYIYIVGDKSVYDAVRLRSSAPGNPPFPGRTQADQGGSDDNEYTYRYHFIDRYVGSTPDQSKKPTLIAGGNLSLTFQTGINRGGIITSSDTLTLKGKSTSATFDNDALFIYRNNWLATWVDTDIGSGDEDYLYNDHYQQRVENSVELGSVGASVTARVIDGGGFSFKNVGSSASATAAKPGAMPGAGTATNVAAPTSGTSLQSAATGVGGATTIDKVGSIAGKAVSLTSVATVGLGTIAGGLTVGGVAGTPVDTASTTVTTLVDAIVRGGHNVNTVVAQNVTAGIAGSFSGPATITFGTATVTLPNSPNGLFVQTTNPNAGYLIETNPLFTSGQDAVGLNLLASLLDLDPDGLIRRLGDAQYEDYLIRTQLIDQLGTNLIARGITQAQQTEALIRSASAQARPLGLTYGAALTPVQQAALKTDLVWMVATSINGQVVLAPVVYLSAATRGAFDKGDANVAANYANLALTSLVNNGGTISGNVLAVSATGDITNTSGRITGGKVLLTAGGSVVNQTFAQYAGNTTVGSTNIGRTAEISATGGLLIDASGDIRNVGATLFSGGPTALIAGKSITIESIVDRRAQDKNDVQTASATNIGSNVTIDGDLFAKAGQDFTLAASKMAVTGLASIDAGRDVNIVSRADTMSKTTHETGGNIFSRTTTDITETTEKSSGSSLKAGELYVKSGNNTNVQGSSIAVAGNAFLDVGGDLQVRADTDKTTRSEQTRSTGLGVGGGLFGDQKVTKYDEAGTNVGSSIQIGGQGVAIAKGDVNLVGSTMHADSSLGVKGANVRILDGQSYTLSTSKTETMTILGSGAGGSVGADASASGGVYAGGHTVGGGTGVGGSAGGQASSNGLTSTDITRQATADKGFDVRAAQVDEKGEDTEHAQTGANSAGFAGKAQVGANVNGNASVSLAQYSTTTTRDYSSKSVGSELSSGDKLTVVADQDLLIRGSKVSAAKDALLSATDVKVQTGQNVEDHSRETMTTGVGIFIDSKNQGSLSAQAQGTVGTTGTSNVGGRDITASGGGASTGGNLGQTGGAASVSLNAAASSANNVDFAQNSMSSQSSRNVTNTGSEIAAGGTLTVVAKDNLSVTGSTLSGDAGVGLKAKNMEFLAAQNTSETSSGDRMTAVGLFADAGSSATASAGLGGDSQSKGGEAGAKVSAQADTGAGVQARNTMDMASTSSSSAVTTAIKSANGNIVRVADGKITDEGTQITAGGDLIQKATTWDSKAAQNTSSASAATFVDRVREGVFAEAGAGAGSDASAQGSAGTQKKEASASATGGAAAGFAGGVLHSDEQTSEKKSTAVVSNITTGGKVVSITTDKTSLEGTNFKAGGDVTLAAGSLDITAAKDTVTSSGLANSYQSKGQIGLDAEKLGTGYGSIEYKGSGSNGTETTSHAGSIDAGGKVTIVSQGATNLEGTTLASGGDMTLYSKGDLNYTAAKDTKSELAHEQEVGGSISFAGKRGENAAVKLGVGVGSTDETTATAGSMTSGGKLTVVSDGNANFAGTTFKGAGDTAIVAAKDLTLGTADSTKNNYEATAGFGLSASRAGETSATGQAVNGGTATPPTGGATGAGSTGAGTTGIDAAGATSTGTNGSATGGSGWTSATRTAKTGTTAPAGAAVAGGAAQPAAATTTASSGILARSGEDQQVGLSASASFKMDKSTDRSASSVESTNGNVLIKAGGDLNAQGTDIKAGQTAILDAGRNLNFGTADSTGITVDAEANLLGTRGSPGGVGTHVTDRTTSVSTEGMGANNAAADGATLNNNGGLTQSAGATADTKLAGGISAGVSAGYSEERKAGSIEAKNIVTRSGGTTTFTGTDLNASKDIAIAAGGDVKFDTAKSVSVDGSIGFGMQAQGNPGRIGGNTAVAATPGGTTPGGTTAAPAGGTAAAAPASPPKIGTRMEANAPSVATAASGTAGNVAIDTATNAANAPVEAKERPVSGGVTDAGIGVAVTNKYGEVNAGGALTINSGGKVSMDGTTGDVGSSVINAVGGVSREAAVSANAEIGMTRAGAGLDIQLADLGQNGVTVTGNAARGAVQQAVTVPAIVPGEVAGAAFAARPEIAVVDETAQQVTVPGFVRPDTAFAAIGRPASASPPIVPASGAVPVPVVGPAAIGGASAPIAASPSVAGIAPGGRALVVAAPASAAPVTMVGPVQAITPPSVAVPIVTPVLPVAIAQPASTGAVTTSGPVPGATVPMAGGMTELPVRAQTSMPILVEPSTSGPSVPGVPMSMDATMPGGIAPVGPTQSSNGLTQSPSSGKPSATMITPTAVVGAQPAAVSLPLTVSPASGEPSSVSATTPANATPPTAPPMPGVRPSTLPATPSNVTPPAAIPVAGSRPSLPVVTPGTPGMQPSPPETTPASVAPPAHSPAPVNSPAAGIAAPAPSGTRTTPITPDPAMLGNSMPVGAPVAPAISGGVPSSGTPALPGAGLQPVPAASGAISSSDTSFSQSARPVAAEPGLLTVPLAPVAAQTIIGLPTPAAPPFAVSEIPAESSPIVVAQLVRPLVSQPGSLISTAPKSTVNNPPATQAVTSISSTIPLGSQQTGVVALTQIDGGNGGAVGTLLSATTPMKSAPPATVVPSANVILAAPPIAATSGATGTSTSANTDASATSIQGGRAPGGMTSQIVTGDIDLGPVSRPQSETAATADRLAVNGGKTELATGVVLHLPARLAHWTIAGSSVSTRVDLSVVINGRRPLLVLPNGLRAPAWMTLDMKTGIVSGVIPENVNAATYLRQAQIR